MSYICTTWSGSNHDCGKGEGAFDNHQSKEFDKNNVQDILEDWGIDKLKLE